METYHINKAQARRFMLSKHGLIGSHRFSGAEGVMRFIRQAGCIQFDPIDVCGQNAQLVLQSRVAGFGKDILYDLLYKERKLVDYFDKNLAIFPVEDWPYFARHRANALNGRSIEKVTQVEADVLALVGERGFLQARDLDMKERTDWYWTAGTLGRAVLETLYFQGKLVVHHKKGTQKFYALADRHIPREIMDAPDPNPELADYLRWQTLRRIGSVGMMWRRASDAWLALPQYTSGNRNAAFEQLIAQNALCAARVDGIKDELYFPSRDATLMQAVLDGEVDDRPRMEFIAPLDNFMWDRKIIAALFDFEYKWEIYTPVAQRQYGYYVLPVLYGEGFYGRIEARADRKNGVLKVIQVWREDGAGSKQGEKALKECIERFCEFNNCKKVEKEAGCAL